MSKINSEIVMGCEARDLLTGVKGYVSQKVEMLNGNIQYALQPFDKKGEILREAILVDFHLIEVLGPGVSDKIKVKPQETDIKVGNQVEDLISKDTGIVSEKVTFTNGCCSFFVNWDNNENPTPIIPKPDCHISSVRLKKIGPGIAQEVSPTTDNKNKDNLPTGGPARKAIKMR